MPAPLSIVIPTLNAQDGLARTLAALGPGLAAGIIREVVVSDGGSTDATCSIAEDAGAVVVTGAPGRGGQIGRGVGVSKGDWVLILHADTVLEATWPDAVAAHFARHGGSAGYFRLAFAARGVWPSLVAGGANLRSRVFGLPYGDQGFLVKRAALDAAGGVPDVPLMEDVALARAFKGRLHPLDGVATTSAARYERDGWGRRVMRNLWILLRYRLGADPAALIKAYRR
ncbi:MAG: TIGR04283 family arsenosugar biosynthesis glycosyltransferase [Pseudomonadota bacterium]